MATLTVAEKAQIQWAIDYMLAAGVEKPLDAKVVEVLLPMAVKFGYPSAQAPQTGLMESLRDAPFSTLLTALLAVSA